MARVRSYSTWRNSACLKEYGDSAASAAFLGTRGDEPQLLARELVADVWPTQTAIPLECCLRSY